MGFDVSYHPLDLDFIHGRLIPALSTGDGLDELRARAERLAKIRYLANAWGLGVNEACRAQWTATQEKPAPAKAAKQGLLSRFLGRQAKAADVATEPAAASRYDSDLHVWGRPFFITADDPRDVSAAIDAWLRVEPSGVEALARGMVERLAPELLATVAPDLGKGLPTDEQFAEAVASAMDPCRDVLSALAEGRTFMTEDGQEVAPADLAGADLAFIILRIASWFRPGWMDRGDVWPTLALGKVVASGYWKPATALLAPILEPHHPVPTLSPTITLNYQVGGMVAAQDVPRLRRDVEAFRSRLLEAGHPEASLRKLHEAVSDAETRGIAFCEATEIYSGPEGVMN